MKNNILKNDRIKYLKDVKKLANQFLDENKNLKQNAKGWKLEVVENNIFQLEEIIKKINKACGERPLKEHVNFDLKLEEYKQNQTKFEIDNEMWRIWWEKMNEGFIYYKILRYSVSYSIIHDLYWIEDGTIQDQIEIVIGKKSPEILGQFLRSKVDFAEKEVLPYLKNDEKYKITISVFETAILESAKDSYLTSNILLITGIESLVRLLGKFVYSHQNPSLSEQEVDNYIFNKFLSLEGLISKGDWKEDIFVKLADAVLMNEYILDESVQKAEEIRRMHVEAQKIIKVKLEEFTNYLQSEGIVNNEEEAREAIKEKLDEIIKIAEDNMINYNEENIGISFRTKLQFLMRRYKEDRNQLIHGNFAAFDFKWKNYIYFSALQKVFKLIKEYNEKYKTA